ncbi:MAG: EamA family transporter [Massilia sp.]|jgi:drug/metabolite transporter (DMT)-like permease|nr:EamA family transporter [Massilia sp.]
MNSTVAGAVLLGALLHASWNALVKSRTDTFMMTVLVAGGAGLLSALALPLLAAPAAASWPYIAASIVIQLAYYALLVAAYRDGDMSHAYPLMRGSAPLLVALASGPLIGERLGLVQWLAVACICGGILALYFTARGRHPGARRTTRFALMTACMIACFTLVDGIGVRKSGAPLAYTMWIFLGNGIGLAAWAAARRPRQLASYARTNLQVMLLGGAANLGSYALALWAMTQAPVAAVAALRETSILFAAAIAALVLGEKVGARRLAAIALVACGAVAMRLG